MQIELVHSLSNGGIVTQMSLLDPDDPELNMTQFYYDRFSASNQPQKRESLLLKNIGRDGLVDIAKLLEDWLDTKSTPRLFEFLSDINAEYELDEHPDSGGSTEQRRHSSNIEMSIDDIRIRFSLGSSDCDLVVPVGESIKKQTTQTGYGRSTSDDSIFLSNDWKNAVRYRDFMFDFFDKRYDGDVEIYDTGILTEKTAINKIELIFERFDKVTQQLTDRSRDREPLTMSDEYDVQYLLQAMLKLYFDDVRDESYLRQHAGVSSRIDFLIESEKIGIETKRLGDSRPPKEIGGEIAEDKEQYKDDTMVDTLLCFLYDPERRFNNPAEYEKDLSEDGINLNTRVTIIPK